jgi:TonB family protein
MPQPQPEPQKANEPVPDKAEPVKERKHAIEVSTTPIKRQRDESFEVGRAAEKRAREAGETRQRAAAAIGRAVRGIESGLSGSTTIELQGPGGGGVPYANWKQAVKTAYDRAWVLPAGVAADSATTTVTVTIARDGTVISSSITRFSGNADVDQSVQATLDRVRYAAPLPDDAKEDQRTITIYFDVKAKLLG